MWEKVGKIIEYIEDPEILYNIAESFIAKREF